MSLTQQTHAARLLDDIEAVNARVRALAAELDDGQLHWHPEEREWSIGQVFEHLIVAHDSYLERIRALVSRGAARPPAPDAIWKPSLVGGMLARSLSSERKFPTPRIWRPAAQPRSRVIEAFMEQQATLVDLMRAAGGLDWRRSRTSSPVSPLLRMNLGDCFTIIVVHEQRHLEQIERVRSRPGFPAGASVGRTAAAAGTRM